MKIVRVEIAIRLIYYQENQGIIPITTYRKGMSMKVKLPNDRVAQVGVQYLDDEQPKLERPLPSDIAGKPFRSIKICVTVWKKGKKKKAKSVTGKSWCNPRDQFNKFEGRRKAMRRLFDKAGELLSKEDRRELAPVLLGRSQVD